MGGAGRDTIWFDALVIAPIIFPDFRCHLAEQAVRLILWHLRSRQIDQPRLRKCWTLIVFGFVLSRYWKRFRCDGFPSYPRSANGFQEVGIVLCEIFLNPINVAIHLLPQLTKLVGWRNQLPHLALKFRPRLCPLKLHLQAVHKFLAVEDALHLGRIDWYTGAVSGFSRYTGRSILRVSDHKIQFASLKLVALKLL